MKTGDQRKDQFAEALAFVQLAHQNQAAIGSGSHDELALQFVVGFSLDQNAQGEVRRMPRLPPGLRASGEMKIGNLRLQIGDCKS